MVKYKGIKHRNLSRIVDIEYDNVSNERQVYFLCEAYNASLLDLYRTSKQEDVDFSED